MFCHQTSLLHPDFCLSESDGLLLDFKVLNDHKLCIKTAQNKQNTASVPEVFISNPNSSFNTITNMLSSLSLQTAFKMLQF